MTGLGCNDKRALSVRGEHSVAERNLWWGFLFTSQGLPAVSDEKRLPDTHRKKLCGRQRVDDRERKTAAIGCLFQFP